MDSHNARTSRRVFITCHLTVCIVPDSFSVGEVNEDTLIEVHRFYEVRRAMKSVDISLCLHSELLSAKALYRTLLPQSSKVLP
jgi:hypothetical protein